MKKIFEIEKDGVIDRLFNKSAIKRTMAQVAIESRAKDRLEIAERFIDEQNELDREAWKMVFEIFPEAEYKACSFTREPIPSIFYDDEE